MMSRIAESARVTVLLADYANADTAGKVNALGAGWAITGVDPQTGLIAPQTLTVFVDTPPELYGEEFTISLGLRDADASPVTIPGPDGAPQTLRLTQTMRADEPLLPAEMNVPRHTVWAHSQVIATFPSGLPLTGGQTYRWVIELDGKTSDQWTVPFYVPLPRSLPQFGGLADPAAVPGL